MKKDNKLHITKKMIENMEVAEDEDVDINSIQDYINDISSVANSSIPSVGNSSISSYGPTDMNSLYSYSWGYVNPVSYVSIDPYKDQYNDVMNKFHKIKVKRENKITQISLENIKNIIEIKHMQTSLEYNTNFLNGVFEQHSESIDIFDIPDVEIYTINRKCSSILIDISIYRKIKKLDYSFVIDLVNNKIYIMFDDEKDLAKFKIQYSGV